MNPAEARYRIESTPLPGTHRVFAATRLSDGARVVVKRAPGPYPRPEDVGALRHEWTVLKRLEGAKVTRALDLISERGASGLVMELAPGRPLTAIIEQERPDPKRFVALALAAAKSLADVHGRGFVHRDIKPHHFFIDEAKGEATVIDFGLATALPRERHLPVEVDRLEGTLAYISPEQTGRMNRSVDRRSDLYSLGVTLYEVCTGKLPFTSEDALELVHAHIARAPAPPRTLRPDLPEVIENIILRLLAKNPDERYQTSAGLIADLERVRSELGVSARATVFELARRDHPGELRIREKLYGRAEERRTLVEAVNRAQRGACELTLISGAPGVGKSALVQDVYREIVRGGHFVSGKFDQYNRGIPYSALASACGELVRAFLASPAEELEAFRRRLVEALGQHARVVIEVVPELAVVLGEQPAVAPLPPTEAQSRFERMFRRFMEASACEASPLVLFVDDLQWADSASLAVLELVLSAPTQGHLLVIGSYRDNEVDAAHPLSRCIERLERALPIHRIELGSLSPSDVHELVAEALSLTRQDPAPLASLIAEKTSGNPFFVAQFLERLAAQGHLTFEPGRGFSWDLEAIAALGATDNVVDLVVQRLGALEPRARELLEMAGCIGHTFRLQQLAIIAASTAREVAGALAPAVTGGYLLPLDRHHHLLEDLLEADEGATVDVRFKFAHDRVQQAALSTIDAKERARVHLRIGRLLLSSASEGGPADDQLFEVVAQLNLGRGLIEDEGERLRLARLNLRAAARAKSAAAQAAVLEMAGVCLELLGPEPFTVDHETCLAAHLLAIESHYLTNDAESAFALIDIIERHAKTILERVPARNLKTNLLTHQGKLEAACALGVETLGLLGVALPDPADQAALGQAIGAAFGAYQQALGGREVASLRDLPPMTDPAQLALVNTLAVIVPAAFQSNQNLMALTVLTAVRLPLSHGTAPVSPFIYALYGVTHHVATGDYERSYQFGLLALDLAARPEHVAARGVAKFIFAGSVSPWARPLWEGYPYFEQAVVEALDVGDQIGAAFAISIHAAYRFYAGDELAELARSIPAFMKVLAAQGDVINQMMLIVVERSVACLRGATAADGRMDGDGFREADFEQQAPVTVKALYGSHKAAVRYLLGDEEGARLAAEELIPLPGSYNNVDHAFYHGMACATLASRAQPGERSELLTKADADLAKLARWAQACPHNVAAMHKLLGAEIHAARGEDLQALDGYEAAIDAAEGATAIHHLALAHEHAGRFHLRAGRKRLGALALRDALYHYERWGASAKVKQLREQFPDVAAVAQTFQPETQVLATAKRSSTRTGTGGDRLDLLSAMRAAQAVASELRLEPLLRRLMRILVENAGATRAVLVLDEGGALKVRATLRVDPEEIAVDLDEPLEASGSVATAVVQRCARSAKPLVIDDVSRDRLFARDPVLRERSPKSVACLPLMHQGKLVGVFYLENQTTGGAFHAARIERLEFLAGHAAVSLQNARLYDEVEAANATLERRVRERTAELSDRNRDMRRVLDNVAQGLVTIDLAGRLSSERSRVVDEWFGEIQPDTSFPVYMARVDKAFADNFEVAFEQLLEGYLPEELLLAQLPARLDHRGRNFRLSYEPIRAADTLSGLLIVLDDITEALRRARDEVELKEELALCQHLSRDRSGLLTFFGEADRLVEALSGEGAATDELRRSLHTLKGNAAMFGLPLLAERCQAAEDAIAAPPFDPRQLAPVIERYGLLRKTLDTLAGGNAAERVELSRDVLRSLAARLGAGMSPTDASCAVERLLLEPLARPLARLGEHACALSLRLGKGEPVLDIDAGGLLGDSQRGHALFAALVHVVRNAVDHGLEKPEERAHLGKGRPALWLSARVAGGELFIELEDDGRGVDWERIRALAEARGLPSATSTDLVDALFAPALSTREHVTATSGRGVGLDAVRTEVERLSGRVEVASERGRGTAFRVRLPLEALGIQADEEVPTGERHATGAAQAREHRPM